MTTTTNNSGLKSVIRLLLDKYRIRDILTTIAEVCIEKGDNMFLTGVQSGDLKKSTMGEHLGKIGQLLAKFISGEYKGEK